MARNKHPEETVEKILDSAARLFVEKGYEKTSLQDILDQTGLSKGAIYHHFASKEEIFIRICERVGGENARALAAIRDEKGLNGREKLQKIFRAALLSANQKKMLDMVPYLLDQPKFLAIQMRDLYEEVAPNYIEPILREGIADGSIRAENPRELAEALMILSDIWLHPLLRPTAPEVMRARLKVFARLMRGIGLEPMDLDTERAYVSLAEGLHARNAGKPGNDSGRDTTLP